MEKGSIQCVERTFELLELLARSANPLSLKEISAKCNLALPTAHRLLNNLCSLKYVIHERGGYYRVSLKLYELANQTTPRSSLIAIAKPYIDELSSSLGESVHLVVRDENDVVYVYKVTQPIGSIQMASKIGMRLPMYRCATGKAIMASLPNGEIKKIFESSNVISVTKNTITDFADLMKEINQVRINNYAMDNEENEELISCIATSLGREGDDINYAVSVSTLTARLTDEHKNEIITALLKTKNKVEQLLVAE